MNRKVSEDDIALATLLNLILTPFNLALYFLAILLLWKWFIAPLTDVVIPELSVTQAIGIGLTVSVLRGSQYLGDRTSVEILSMNIAKFVIRLVILGIAYALVT